MWFKLDDKFIDEIVRQGLVDTYVGLKRDIVRVKKGGLTAHVEDVDRWKQVLYAIDILGEWYFTDFEAAVKQRKKK